MKLLVWAILLLPSHAFAKGGLDSSTIGVKFGLLYGCLGSSGVSMMTPISKNLHLELAYLNSRIDRSSRVLTSGDETGTSDLTAEDATITVAEQRRKMLHTQFRWFAFSNSFNFALGFAGARIDAKIEATDNASGEAIEQTHQIDYAATSFSVGNMWSKNGWFFGVDWYGFMNPTYKNETKDVIGPVEQNATLNALSENFDHAANYCANIGGPILMSMTAGLQF